MEIQKLSEEDIIKKLEEYDKTYQKEQKQKKVKIWLFSAIVLGLWLYLRLFNTIYDTEDIEYGEISTKCSTAWIVRYPSTYKGNKITTIDNGTNYFNVFCPYAKYIYIEDGIEEIGLSEEDYIGGFQYSKIRAVRLPNTIKVICKEAFSGCRSLKKVYWENAKEGAVIGECAFAYTSLKEMIVPHGVSTIKRDAFYNNKLEYVKMADTVTSIEQFAFAGCKNLKEVELSKSLDTLPTAAFLECENLETLKNIDSIRCVKDGALVGTKISEDIFSEKVYYMSNGRLSTNSEDRYSQSSYTLDKMILSDVTDVTYTYDYEKESEYLSEKTGFPVELFNEPLDSGRIWIEGKYYTFPMELEDFVLQDQWELGEVSTLDTGEQCIEVCHKTTQKRMEVIVKFSMETYITGLVTGDKTNKNACSVILPGGIMNQGMQGYRLFVLFDVEKKDGYATNTYIYHMINGEHSAEISFEADGCTGELERMIYLIE